VSEPRSSNARERHLQLTCPIRSKFQKLRVQKSDLQNRSRVLARGFPQISTMSLRHLIPVITDDTPSVALPIIHSSLETRAAPAAFLPLLFVAPDASNATVPQMVPANSKRNRVLPACFGCKKAKVRCEGSSAGGSCARCAKLQVNCIFPEPSSSAAAAVPRNGDAVGQAANTKDIDDNNIHLPSRKRLEVSSKVEDIAEYQPFR